MFDLPDAKRIRRSDLNRSRSSSPTSPSSPTSTQSPRAKAADTEARTALLQAKLAALLGPISFEALVSENKGKDGNTKLPAEGAADRGRGNRRKRTMRGSVDDENDEDMNSNSHSDSDSDSNSPSSSTAPSPPPEEEEQEQEYLFTLFAPHPINSSDAPLLPQKIILSSDTPTGSGRILRPRPREYYIKAKSTGEKREQWEVAAVSGEEVLRGKERRHWGFEVAWRVKALRVAESGSGRFGDRKSSRKINPAASTDPTISHTLDFPLVPSDLERKDVKRTKPNKKRRIHLREKRREREIAEAKKRIEKEGKEEAEKEKRTRRNREKKVKRKMKEKAKKAGAGGGGGGGGEGDMVDMKVDEDVGGKGDGNE